MLTHHQRNVLLTSMAVMLAVCLAGSALCVLSQSLMTQLPVPFGYLMSVCGVYRTQPSFQMGLTFASPFLSSAYPPYGGPGHGCYLIPWLPVLPQRLALLVPW